MDIVDWVDNLDRIGGKRRELFRPVHNVHPVHFVHLDLATRFPKLCF